MADREEVSTFNPARLTEFRKAAGMSQRALAHTAGISQALVAELERGKHPPSAASLAKLASALSVPVTAFNGS